MPHTEVRAFVDLIERHRLPDMSFRNDARLDPLPVQLDSPTLSRYLLLAAAIDAQTNSNNIRPFLARLDRRAKREGLARGLFDLTAGNAKLIESVIIADRCLRGWSWRKYVPRILSEANAFVEDYCDGDLDAWAGSFTNVAPIVDALATNIHRQGINPGDQTRKKMWMLMRWLVRPKPDLWRWKRLNPAELMVPVDAHVARFAARLGVIEERRAKDPLWREVEVITAYARTLFPSDPAKIDYAFFMWSRSHGARALEPDMCATLFKRAAVRCPLVAVLPCSERCR